MTFLAPHMLYVLLAVPALVAAYVVLQRRRRTYAVRFTNLELLATVAPRRPGWRRHVAASLLLATFVVLIGALARPSVGTRVPREQASIMLVMDVSRSMSATDLAPDRMGASKKAAADFVRSLPKRLRVGVVAFSDTAQLVSALTGDRDQTVRAIEALRPVAGTAMGDGMSVALDEILRQRSGSEKVPASVLLLSDGQSNRGLVPSEVATAARTMSVPIYTIGVGTQGATLDVGGRIVPVDLNEEELQAIAEATGGKYFRTGDAGTLSEVYKGLGSALGYQRGRREATTTAAGIAVVLLLAAATAGLLWFQRIP